MWRRENGKNAPASACRSPALPTPHRPGVAATLMGAAMPSRFLPSPLPSSYPMPCTTRNN